MQTSQGKLIIINMHKPLCTAPNLNTRCVSIQLNAKFTFNRTPPPPSRRQLIVWLHIPAPILSLREPVKESSALNNFLFSSDWIDNDDDCNNHNQHDLKAKTQIVAKSRLSYPVLRSQKSHLEIKLIDQSLITIIVLNAPSHLLPIVTLLLWWEHFRLDELYEYL